MALTRISKLAAIQAGLGGHDTRTLLKIFPQQRPRPVKSGFDRLLSNIQTRGRLSHRQSLDRRNWTGTALELLRPLVPCQTPKGVAQQLGKCALTLADHGIEVKFRYLHGHKRFIEIHEESGEASCEKPASDTSPGAGVSSQLSEKKELAEA